jgi:ribosome-binding protein aMBF1 (putative translation factor)
MKGRNGTNRARTQLPTPHVATALTDFPSVLDSAGARTHVLVPVDRFNQLSDAERALRAMEALESDSSEWIDADTSALRLAGSRLRRARIAKGLTQKQLAERLRIPQSQVSRIEREPDRSTLRTLKRIAKALGVDIRALI